MTSPLDILLPYQKAWVADRSRRKIGLWARQTGKSFATAAEAVQDCLTRRTTWVCLSAGERQALEWMRKAREWAEAWKIAIEDYVEIRDAAQAILKSAEITWPTGSRIVALPARPETVRGYTANLCLDEFAFHERPDDIWRAIYPSISSPLRGELRIAVVSTPNGLGNRFADIWHKGRGWSRHKITIHDAVAAGLPCDVEELRTGLDDPEAWAQEYECEFLDASAVLLPYELIASIESPEASDQPPDQWPADADARRVMGIDFGRKRDRTVAWTLERIGDVWWTREVLVLDRIPTPAQVEALAPRVAKCRLVALDYTGPGVGLGDYLAERFGLFDPGAHRFGRIKHVTFARQSVVEIYSHLRLAAERKDIRIPISREIREDLHAVYRIATPSGFTYRAPHSQDGHSDRCAALALAWHAAEIIAAARGCMDPATITIGGRHRRWRPVWRS
jgi:phage FluMu gp28-like protein